MSSEVQGGEWNEAYESISWWDSARIASARILVVGAGALGNEVLKNLTLLNVGQIMIVDFDHVEYSNLSRSVLFRKSDSEHMRPKCDVVAERIKEINPNVKVLALNGDVGYDVGLGVLRRMDVVIGCLDNRLARLMINRLCFRVGKTWIDGAIENMSGQVAVYRPDQSCYECQLTEKEWRNIQVRLGCPDVARRNEAKGRIATTPVSASIIAAMQAQEALKVIYANDDQLLAGRKFHYDGMNNLALYADLGPLREQCESHFPLIEILEAEDLTSQHTISDLFDYCVEHLSGESFVLQLDYEVVLQIAAENPDIQKDVFLPKHKLSDTYLKQFEKRPGQEFMIIDSFDSIDQDFPKPELTLAQLGIPPLQILTIESETDVHFIELSGDLSYLTFT